MPDYTEADLDKIRKARASPYRTIRYGDRELGMKADIELRQVEADILRATSATAAGGRRRSRVRIVPFKDL
jgi:hypothetical protein